MRRIIRDALVLDPILSATMGDRWHPSRGVDGIDEQALGIARPFGVYRIVGTQPVAGRTTSSSLEIWIHDDSGSYLRIDALLARVRAVLTGIEQRYDSSNNSWVQQISWNSTSPDLFDDIRRTNTRMASFTLVGNGE